MIATDQNNYTETKNYQFQLLHFSISIDYIHQKNIQFNTLHIFTANIKYIFIMIIFIILFNHFIKTWRGIFLANGSVLNIEAIFHINHKRCVWFHCVGGFGKWSKGKGAVVIERLYMLFRLNINSYNTRDMKPCGYGSNGVVVVWSSIRTTMGLCVRFVWPIVRKKYIH